MHKPAPSLPLYLSARLDALLEEARRDYGPLQADWYDGPQALGPLPWGRLAVLALLLAAFVAIPVILL